MLHEAQPIPSDTINMSAVEEQLGGTIALLGALLHDFLPSASAMDETAIAFAASSLTAIPREVTRAPARQSHFFMGVFYEEHPLSSRDAMPRFALHTFTLGTSLVRNYEAGPV